MSRYAKEVMSMFHRFRYPAIAMLLLATVAVGGTDLRARAAPLASSPLFAATPVVPAPADCVVWRNGPDAPRVPDECTLSTPWWMAWFDCAITPVHGERWPAQGPGDHGLERIPWVQAEPTAAGLVGHLFFGSRPLHTGNRFPDGGRAKVLWSFDRPVAGFAMTATNLWQPGQTITLRPADTDGTLSAQWPSYVDIPTAGCWRVDLHAHWEQGDVTASVTFIVVDG